MTHVPYTAMTHDIAQSLKREGYIKSIEKKGKRVRKSLMIELQSPDAGAKTIENVRFFSTPGRKQYAQCDAIRPSRYGGAVILSTSKGIMSGREAKKARSGGLLIAEIW